MNTELTHDRSWFTGNQLKYLAALLMVLDHTNKYLLPNVKWLTMLGRLVIPIFVFMVAEGMYYTHSRKKYLLQLLIGFEAMSLINIAVNRIFVFHQIDLNAIPEGVNIAHTSVSNNIFGTMFMIALVITIVDWIIESVTKKHAIHAVLSVIALAALVTISYVMLDVNMRILRLIMDERSPLELLDIIKMLPTLFSTEGGFAIILLGVAYYFLRRWRWAQLLALAAESIYFFFENYAYTSGDVQWMMGFAIILLLFYNGKRGKGVNPKFDKWFFYVFYPAHIYMLYIIGWVIQR